MKHVFSNKFLLVCFRSSFSFLLSFFLSFFFLAVGGGGDEWLLLLLLQNLEMTC